MKKNIVICAHRQWNKDTISRRMDEISEKFCTIMISCKEDLTESRLKDIEPEYVFFMDWSWIVPESIISNYKCVNFHTAPLPDFRGGSPIQNQIIRGIKKSKLSAHWMTKELDSGDILLQEDVSLEGHIREIFSRISDKSFDMIKKIINHDFVTRKQVGEGFFCKRRTPAESELKPDDFEKPIGYLYDFIRMLEDPYPNAFMRVGNKKIIFKEAEIRNGKLNITAEIEGQ